MSVSFSPDNQQLASASADKTIRLWTTDGRLLKTFEGHQDWVNRVEFSPDGKRIASVSLDRTGKLWNLEGKALLTLDSQLEDLSHLSFSSNGKYIATANANKAQLWDFKGNLLHTLQGDSDKAFVSLSFSPNSQKLASIRQDGTLDLWNLKDEIHHTGLGGNGDVAQIGSAAFSSDWSGVISVNSEGVFRFWNLNLNQLLENDCARLKNYLNNRSVSDNERKICSS
jgi:WD40 repeat protein